jgi:hypothetical protein
LKPKLVLIIFKNSVRTAKKTPHFTVAKTNWLFTDRIALYSENETKHINGYKVKSSLIVEAGGA